MNANGPALARPPVSIVFGLAARGGGHALTVIGAQVIPVRLFLIALRIELRCLLDLVFGAVHEQLAVGDVDLMDDASRQQYLLAEDPRPGVDHDVARASVVGRLVDGPDVAVDSLHAEARDIGVAPG